YRNFGSYRSLVVNETINSSSSTAAPLWMEFRDTGSGFSLFQSLTFKPDTTSHRWMASIAQDQQGNMLMGYSLSSPGAGIAPSIRVTGRLAGDPLGTMQAET